MNYNYTPLPIFDSIFPFITFFDDKKEYSPKKKNLIKYQIRQMIKRTSQMFEWKNLPEKIPQRDLELMLQINGYCGFILHEGNYYAVWGGLGGKPNWNYMPSNLVVANPYLKLSKTYNIYDIDNKKRDVVIIPNDTLYEGLIPLLSFHSELLTEIQLTKRATVIVHRMPNVPVAPDNGTKEDIDDFFDDLMDGEIKSIASSDFLKDVGTMPLTEQGRNIITQVLEMEQYQRASLFNDLGLQMNYNMKRESITSSEAQLGEGSLLPLFEDMLNQRKYACEQINELFGLNVEVDLSSSWKNLRKSIDNEIKKEETELNEKNEVQSIEQNSDNKSEETDKKEDLDNEDKTETP